MTDPAEALRYILKKKIPGCENSSPRMAASSTKLPEKALEIVPLDKKDCFDKLEKNKSVKLNVAENSQNVLEPTTSEQMFLINKNKSLKNLQFVSGKPSQKSNLSEDIALDLTVGGSRIKSPGKEKIIISQSSDGGWEFLDKRC